MRSHASAISKPPPNALPSTAAISGFARTRSLDPCEPATGRPDDAALAPPHGLEVGTGAEHVPGVRDDADHHVVVGLDAIDGGFDGLRHRSVDGVARVGPIQRDDRDRAVLLEAQHRRRVTQASARPVSRETSGW